MTNACEPFEGKKVTLLGLGLLGRGVGDTAFLADCGAKVVVTDKKTEEELAASVEQLKKYPNIIFHLGGHEVQDFTNCDLVIKAAGVPLDSPEIAAARAAGVKVAMSTALFAKYAMEIGAKVVGVTGTRGKSTVTHMIFRTLKQSGKRAHIGGNVRGLSTLAMLPEIESGDIVVLELDSWQLQGFGDLQLSPQIAVVTNLMQDHQNYYPDMETYFADKANIFRYQKPNDSLFVGKTIFEKVSAAPPPAGPRVPDSIPSDWNLKVVGVHNRENASLAAAALSVLGLSQEEIKAGIESFEAVEGRLQFVREVGGIKIYNDNNATTPEATIAALKALPDGRQGSHKNVTLIVGGSDKGLPLEELVSEIKQHVSHGILLTHENYKGSARLAELLKKENVVFEEVGDLPSAIKNAVGHTDAHTILFSPAFASFGMFKNEYDRNDQFIAAVQRLH